VRLGDEVVGLSSLLLYRRLFLARILGPLMLIMGADSGGGFIPEGVEELDRVRPRNVLWELARVVEAESQEDADALPQADA
jgi:hypothetical protein